MSTIAIENHIYDQGMMALRSAIEDIRKGRKLLPSFVKTDIVASQRRENVLLVVEDNSRDAFASSELVKAHFPNISVVTCSTIGQGLKELALGVEWAIIDWRFPDGPPLLLLAAARKANIKVCIWTGDTSLDYSDVPVFFKGELTPILGWLRTTLPKSNGICNSKI